VIFLGNGRPEKSQHAIAQQLRDGATISLDRLRHQLQRTVEKDLRFFRIDSRNLLGRSAQVREQNRHMLALMHALQLRRMRARTRGDACVRRIAIRRIRSIRELRAAPGTETMRAIPLHAASTANHANLPVAR